MFGNAFANFGVVTQGVPGFFQPNANALWGIHYPAGPGLAAYYGTDPLKATLADLVDIDRLNSGAMRVAVGAVNVGTGEMRYFDSRDMKLEIPHIMASGALPPAFPAIEIDGALYWDGGVYSNTPVEVVFDDKPRRDALIFTVDLWQPDGKAPETLWQVINRQKDIQYSSRGLSHVARQQQLHRLRHVVRELASRLPKDQGNDPMVAELASYGCGTTMHLVRLLAPRLDQEDHTKDIDFSAEGITTRWQAGYDYVRRVIDQEPWHCEVDALDRRHDPRNERRATHGDPACLRPQKRPPPPAGRTAAAPVGTGGGHHRLHQRHRPWHPGRDGSRRGRGRHERPWRRGPDRGRARANPRRPIGSQPSTWRPT